ncbi:PREDICTED: U-box domain-containing protein 43 [Camelina sativa]|uniref:RING-type E3 ubiquitin transferase n=1 Tax=Camelina sativa TaxID=90675 RepID=A0ABM0WJ36_CAMSA|nr:PREDICTED: U-box domain-containing protein 43 [Camelina sativa]XP_010471791.1 PREDICTED: U-box domain-containing protein 43 [Camelina sativa]XP_010471792.1 PREDICTED: U-box domain-containing protein 43 [Camelina sativa]
MAESGSWDGSQSDNSSQFEPGIDNIYEAFICPLTKQVMHDPVTLENGQTFEREAIEIWFKECRENGQPLSCPITSKELSVTDLSPSIALRNTIEEWRARNDALKLDIARQSLYLANAEANILLALKNVRDICRNIRKIKHRVRNPQLVRLITDMLKSSSHEVRYKALQTLQVVVEGDDESKAIVAEGDNVRTIVKFLTQEQSKGREAAVSVLFELSKSESLCEKIGSVRGAIILLVGLTSSKSEMVSTVEKADKTLTNLEVSEDNVREMASNGRLQPLLAKLLEGSPETKISMASYLGELALNNDVRVIVAQTVGSSLIDLMRTRNMRQREAALRALNNISTFEGSAKVLIDTGILPPLIKDLFYVGPNQLPIRLKEVSATILAKIVNIGYDFYKVPVGPDHQTLVSEEIVENLLQLTSNTGPEIQGKLLAVLVGLTSCPNSVINVVSAIRNSAAIISLVQFVEIHENDDLRLASIKLLHNISPHMSEELANALRGTVGQLASLFAIILENTPTITEEQAAAAGLLAELPERDLVLTMRLLRDGAFEKIISKISGIRQKEIRGIRFERTFLERLVSILARITFALTKETQAVSFCCENNLTAVFIDLLQSNSQDNIQMASAIALENLSLESKNLTRIPELPPPNYCVSIFSCLSKPPVVLGICKIHQGICSVRESFCLVEGQAVDKLVDLLDHENEKVVGAALAALSTLLEDGLEVEKGVRLIDEADGITPILNVLLENQTENLRIRAVWMVERILRIEEIAREVGEEQNVTAALIDAFQNADFKTKQIAENALRHIDKIPNFSEELELSSKVDKQCSLRYKFFLMGVNSKVWF